MDVGGKVAATVTARECETWPLCLHYLPNGLTLCLGISQQGEQRVVAVARGLHKRKGGLRRGPLRSLFVG